MVPLSNDPNAPNPAGYTPIQLAAKKGMVKIVKILAPFSDDPNETDPDGLQFKGQWEMEQLKLWRFWHHCQKIQIL